MDCLSKAESHAWLSDHFDVGLMNLKQMDQLSIPSDAGRKMSLAKLLLDVGQWDDGGLLLVTEWGIWPSCEHWPLFDGYRHSFGEHRPLHEAPGHLITPERFDQATSILAIAMYFMWDVLLISIADQLILQLDHHERLSLAGVDSKRLTEVSSEIVAFLGASETSSLPQR